MHDPSMKINNVFKSSTTFFFLDNVFFWLNSDGKPYTWIQKLKNMENKGLMVLDHSLNTTFAKKEMCLGVEVRKTNINENPTAKAISCKQKSPFLCMVDSAKFTSPSKRTKFPCIPRNLHSRTKRGPDTNDVSLGEAKEKGKYKVGIQNI